MRDNAFFDKNDTYAPFRNIIEGIAKSNDVSVEEAVKDESFAAIFEGKTESDKISAQKTVMESNPRTLQANTKMEEAKTAAASGDKAGLEAGVGAALVEHMAGFNE